MGKLICPLTDDVTRDCRPRLTGESEEQEHAIMSFIIPESCMSPSPSTSSSTSCPAPAHQRGTGLEKDLLRRYSRVCLVGDERGREPVNSGTDGTLE